MPEGLSTLDGERIDLDSSEREFAAAMAAPPASDPEAPAPPDIGRIDPEAPYGRTKDGVPKKGPGGRPSKSRTTTSQQVSSSPAKAGKGKDQPQAPEDFSEGLSEFTQVLWMALAGLPVPREDIRIRCRVQAAVLKSNGAGVVSGVNIIAQHNGAVRWGVKKLAGGEASWIFPAALALMPFAVQTSMLWKAPVNGEMRTMADSVEGEFGEIFKSILAEMGLGGEEEPEPQEAA